MTPRLLATLALVLVALAFVALAIAVLWDGFRPPAPGEELPREQVDRLADRARERAEALWGATTGWRDTV